jgi:hypothetical protein
MYEHEGGGRGVIPVVEFPEQSRNFARIPGIFHAVQEFLRNFRNFADFPDVLHNFKEKIFAKKLYEFY